MDHRNKIWLQGLYGSDESHALSAWTSTSRTLTEEKKQRIPALLKLLAEGSDGNEHGTPFEKSAIHFLVQGEIASHIHALKHRIGVSINGQSARYGELKENNFYIPHDWPIENQKELENACLEAFDKYHTTINNLVAAGISRKRAKESARFFLPYATQLLWDIQFNFRSFVHFIKLRNTPGAQLEIREIAAEMLRLVAEDGRFQHSLNAFKLS